MCSTEAGSGSLEGLLQCAVPRQGVVLYRAHFNVQYRGRERFSRGPTSVCSTEAGSGSLEGPLQCAVPRQGAVL